jgi:hypothetical protein
MMVMIWHTDSSVDGYVIRHTAASRGAGGVRVIDVCGSN